MSLPPQKRYFKSLFRVISLVVLQCLGLLVECRLFELLSCTTHKFSHASMPGLTFDCWLPACDGTKEVVLKTAANPSTLDRLMTYDLKFSISNDPNFWHRHFISLFIHHYFLARWTSLVVHCWLVIFLLLLVTMSYSILLYSPYITETQWNKSYSKALESTVRYQLLRYRTGSTSQTQAHDTPNRAYRRSSVGSKNKDTLGKYSQQFTPFHLCWHNPSSFNHSESQVAGLYLTIIQTYLMSTSMMIDSINYTMAMNVSNSWDAVKMTENYEQVVGGLIFQR